jgi:hypothetical protein
MSPCSLRSSKPPARGGVGPGLLVEGSAKFWVHLPGGSCRGPDIGAASPNEGVTFIRLG